MTLLGQTAPAPAVPALTAVAREDGSTSAATASNLTGDQAAAQLGDSIPLVWCRRQVVSNEDEPEIGGCWVSPAATEARFSNDGSNNLTVWYQLVVSEGQISTLQAGDVWQGDEARGSWTQAYNARAGTWAPGNAVTQQYGYESIVYGSYAFGAPWIGVAAEKWGTPESMEAYRKSLARVTLSSRGEYVTSFETTSVMVDYLDVKATKETGATRFIYFEEPKRRLPNYSFQRQPTPEPYRVQTELVEIGVDYLAATQNQFQAGVTYLIIIKEVNRPPLPMPIAPLFGGTGGGTYAGLSTLSVSATFTSEDDRWRQQVHTFVRGGCQATRLTEGGTGPSCWLPDLARYLLATSSRVSSPLIDTTNLTTACLFNQALGLRFNGVLSQPNNLRDWLQRIAPWFLLLVSNRGGALGLRPALPIDGSYGLNLSEITPVLELNESHLDPDSFRLDYVATDQRQPICLQVLYRSQPANQPGSRQMIEVRFSGEALAGPYQQLDLSEFCCSLRHAIIAGAFELARRRHVAHTLRVACIPIPELATLQAGDVIGITMPRLSTLGSSAHRQLYQLANLTQDSTGRAELSLTHFPVDAAGRSLVALSIASLAPNVIVPAARVTITANVPVVGTGVRLLAPAAAITVAGRAPAWQRLTSVQVPAAAVTVATQEPVVVAPVVAPAAAVQVQAWAPFNVVPMLPPTAEVLVTGHAPAISISTTNIPAATITVAAEVPAVVTGLDPLTLSPAAWWDASESSTVTVVSGNVSAWNDRSGNGFHLSQATSAQRPAYVSSAINSKGAISWPSTNNQLFLGRDSGSTLTVAEVYIVAKFALTAFSSYEGLFNPTGLSGNPWLTGGASGGSFFISDLCTAVYINNSGTNSFTSVLPTLSSPGILRVPASSTKTTTGIRMGVDRSYDSGGYNRGWKGYIAEVLVFSSALNTTNRAKLMTYLSTKWGITIS